MLVPQFSLRRLLATLTAAAGVSLILSFAYQGRVWAMSISAAIVSLLAMVLVQAVVFWLVWLASAVAERFSALRRTRRPGKRGPAGQS